MVSHELSQLQERLAIYKKEQETFKRQHKVNRNSVAIDQKIDKIKRQINELGAKGRLVMAILVIKKELHYFTVDMERHEMKTVTYLFHDLDDYSIYKLIHAYYGEFCISKSLVEIPLKTELPASLNEKFISWQINP